MKIHSTIGCCGIDCGLCPRYHTKGDSVCPGCGGPNFKEKHPTCGIFSCCSIKKGLETCAGCDEFPCRRFDKEKGGNDSFVTHQKIFPNFEQIRIEGIDPFLAQQKTRMEILGYLLEHFDDGRSKSFFCLSCALLPLDNLRETIGETKNITDQDNSGIKEKNRVIREKLQQHALAEGIKLELNNRKNR